MFNFLVSTASGTGSSSSRRRSAGRLRLVRPAARAGRRVPGPQPADRHPDDRGRGPGAGGGRAARHLPARDRDERHAGRRRACARSRASACRSSTSSSTGAPTSTAPASSSPSGWRSCGEQLPAGVTPADGAGHLDHGRDHADRRARATRQVSPMEVREIADLVHAAAAAGHPRRRPGDPHRRRGAAVPRSRPNIAAHAGARRHARADRGRRSRGFGTNTGGGFVDQHGREYLIRNIGRTTRLEDLRNTGGGLQAGPADPAAAGRATVDFAAARQARRRRLQGQARRDPVASRSSPAPTPSTLTGKIEAALAEIQKTLPHGRDGHERPVPAGRLHRGLDRQRRSGCCWRRPPSSPSSCSCSC